MKRINYLLLGLFLLSAVSASLTSTGKISTYFTTGTTEFECVSTYDYAFWLNLSDTNEQIWIFNFTDSVKGMCNSEDYMTNYSCCPEGMYCSGDDVCTIPATGLLSCSDLPDKESCDNPTQGLAQGLFDLFTMEGFDGICSSEGTFERYLGDDGETLCSNRTFCGCTWNASANKCASSLKFETACEGKDPVVTSCNWVESSREDHCEEPQANIIIRFDVSGDADSELCQPQTVEYPCSVSVRLPFFDSFSFVLAFLMIIGVYFIVRNK